MFEQGVFFVSALMRAINYARLIAFKRKPNWYDETLYDDFDFKKNATKTQFILSYAYLLMANTTIALLVITIIYRLF
ncbi:MAG: hypothetical protein COB04_08910 [Gammaproteobacteria bacterium]|nr:MAG: hypothetical protein COB04_08910 [Gammaproteobacteria bacterium]